ncbi:MBL fold metallo-hydrolase [Microbulbifer sp. HZ11]|uniref:MBL fold metallo-hydrolase n=1 Tax=Microbulbifer sp. HZ11 TaxID=1453501 RepID=UPI0005BB53F9|nr:MBL fold metallo-hydrolase [Microbulbifer sp. HZ11]
MSEIATPCTSSTSLNSPGHITHHGAATGVTGSCHQLFADAHNSVLIDCGLFQGAETSPGGRGQHGLHIEFDISTVRALVVTHVHIDHVGRIPYLIAAGFRGPIYRSEPSAELLPLVLEDALKIGFTQDRALIEQEGLAECVVVPGAGTSRCDSA